MIEARYETVKMFIKTYNDTMKSMKESFVKVIQDKSLPLKDRWKLFNDAPKEFREENDWVEDFDSIGDVNWYDDFYYERYQVVYTVDIVDRIVDKQQYPQFKDNPEKLNELKEEILSKNLWSFKFDW